METDGIIILADGDYPSGREALAALNAASRVVCCDGAAHEFVARGGTPWAIVGDCDSLSEDLAERFADRVHRVAEQESNDLTKAVRFCLARGFRHLTILGATGRREDHTLGNISLLVDYAKEDAVVRMITDRGIFEPITGRARFDSFEGQQVSIFTLDPSTLVTTRNLRYPLNHVPLTGWWQGTLNESTASIFSLLLENGWGVVYRLFEC